MRVQRKCGKANLYLTLTIEKSPRLNSFDKIICKSNLLSEKGTLSNGNPVKSKSGLVEIMSD